MNLVPPEFAYAITSRGYKDPVRIFEQGDESLYQVCRYSEHSTPRLEVVGYEKRHHLAFANDCQIYSITMEYSPHVKLNFTACKKAPNYGTFAIEKRVKGTKLPLIDDLVLFVHFEDPKQNPLKFFLHRWANRSLDRARLPTFVTFVPIGTEGTEAPNEGSGEHSPTEDPQEAHDQPFASDECLNPRATKTTTTLPLMTGLNRSALTNKFPLCGPHLRTTKPFANKPLMMSGLNLKATKLRNRIPISTRKTLLGHPLMIDNCFLIFRKWPTSST